MGRYFHFILLGVLLGTAAPAKDRPLPLVWDSTVVLHRTETNATSLEEKVVEASSRGQILFRIQADEDKDPGGDNPFLEPVLIFGTSDFHADWSQMELGQRRYSDFLALQKR